MTAPGITVTTTGFAPPPIPNVPTATWFVTGLTQRGSTTKPIKLTSMQDYANYCGTRTGYTALYDALDLYFREGGLCAYVARLVGPAAVAATVNVKDSAATPVNTISVTANSVGTWGNSLTVQVVAGTVTNTYQLVIALSGTTVEQSPNLSTPDDAVNWAAGVSNYVTITNLNSATTAPNNNPGTGAAQTLSGGLDDNASVSESLWTAGLNLFPPDLGPGQVSAPGRTTDAAHVALLQHAASHNRTALLDAVDTPTASTLLSAASAAIVGTDASRGCLCAPWVTVPGISTGTPVPAPARTVAPSALFAAKIAATDVATQNPNTAAAGAQNGASTYAIGVTQSYTDSDRASLNSVGVNVVRNIASVVQVYGFRSLSADPQWVQLNWSRLRMAIQNDAQSIASNVALFATIDAKGQTLGKLNGQLAGMLQGYWQRGSLYGDTANSAFVVDTSPAVNTAATAAAGQILAVLYVKKAPFAELTQINIVNVPLTQPV